MQAQAAAAAEEVEDDEDDEDEEDVEDEEDEEDEKDEEDEDGEEAGAEAAAAAAAAVAQASAQLVLKYTPAAVKVVQDRQNDFKDPKRPKGSCVLYESMLEYVQLKATGQGSVAANQKRYKAGAPTGPALPSSST